MPVIGGALTAIGVSALLAPVILWSLVTATLVAVAYSAIGYHGSVADALVGATPILLVIGIASLIGGYVSGAIARYAQARSGGAASLLALLLVMAVLAIFVVDLRVLGGIVIVAAVVGIPVALLFGRIGGALAPRAVEITKVPVIAPPPLHIERPQLRPALATGRKGGERTAEHAVYYDDSAGATALADADERDDSPAPRPEDRRP